MAKTQQKDIFAQVRDLGTEALQRLSDVPGGSKVMEMANETRARLDEMQRKLRGLDELEQRVAKLERRLADKSAPSKSGSAKKAAKPKPPPSP